MKYQLQIRKDATKFIKRQDKVTQKRLRNAILELLDNPYAVTGIESMKGYNNTFRKRVGDFRIIFEVMDDILIVDVLDVGNRGDIYKGY